MRRIDGSGKHQVDARKPHSVDPGRGSDFTSQYSASQSSGQSDTPPSAGETLIEEGIVLALIPARGRQPAQATVRLEINESCERCAANAICRPSESDKRTMDVLDPIGVAVGDRVQVAVTGGAVLKASFLVYGLPLLMLLIGVGLGMLIWSEGQPMRDLWSFLLGVALAAAAFPLVIRMVRKTESGGDRILPARIVAVCK